MFKLNKKNLSNIVSLILIITLLVIVFNPNAKATLIKGMMKIGLMNPKIESSQNTKHFPLAPNATFYNENEHPLDLFNQKGKVIFINIWATWCPPCIAELPSIHELYKQYKTNPNLIFILADAHGNIAESKKFLNSKNIDLPLYSFKENLPTEIYKGSLPTTIIIDKSGNIRYQHIGAADYNSQKMINFITQLLGE